MAFIESVNSKANVKQFTGNDLPFSPSQPVINSFYAVSTNGQTSIANLGFSIDTVGNPDVFFLFVDGKKLRLGASNDYVFAAVAADGTSSQITFNQPLAINQNIQAYKLGLKPESTFGSDNRFTAIFEAQGAGFQSFINQTSFINTPTTTTGTPVAGTFYSTIINRASMVDLSQDLKPRMGVERIMTEQLLEIQNEFGSNGEPVFGVLGDTFGQIRLIGGSWQNGGVLSQNGSPIQTGTTQNMMEITFYGTGLNLLSYVNNSVNVVNYSVDGVGSVSFFPGSSSTILQGRNYAPNQIVPVVSNLTLGVHTVRINLATATYSLIVFGVEILNESSSLKINSGVGYAQGQKYTASSQTVAAFNSGFETGTLGTRGGHVLVYQKADGTIGRAVTPTNTSQQNLTSADHTNEEVVRQHGIREFGAGRADDINSLNANTTGNKAFILDDDLTGIMGFSMSVDSSNSTKEGFVPAQTANSYVDFQFIGTGLDIYNSSNSANTSTWTITVDGTAIVTNGAAATFPPLSWVKLVSGLPYGTHVVRIHVGTTVGSAPRLSDYRVYQPKKPALPAGAVELGEYNILANFSANSTAGGSTISTGVVRRCAIREWIYSGSWTINTALGSADTEPGGFELLSTTTGDFGQVTFFGTGFDFRFTTSGTAGTWQISVDGSTALNGFTTTSYGAGIASFTSSTGTVVSNTTVTNGCGITLTGLTLGTHTFKFTKTGGTGAIIVNALDAISPIYSQRYNQALNLQNSLMIGGNSISDNRKLTPIKTAEVQYANWAKAYGITSGPSTTSGTLIPLTDMLVTIKTSGKPVQIFFMGGVFSAVTNGDRIAKLVIDGASYGVSPDLVQNNTNDRATYVLSEMVALGPGVHTIAVFHRSDGTNAMTWQGTDRILFAKEVT